MSLTDTDREHPINLDASSSQELKRVVVVRQADEDPEASHVIPDVHKYSVRSATGRRELLNQTFAEVDV